MRHYKANPTISSNGVHAGGVVGFFKEIEGLCQRLGPQRVHIIWEGGKNHHRETIFKDYKRTQKSQNYNRFYDDIPDTSENRIEQIAFLIKCFKTLPIYQHFVEGCEAIDIIEYISRHIYEYANIVVASSNKGLYQLINDRTIIWSPGQKKEITTNIVLGKICIHPNNIAIARACVGDKNDNIEGIKGVGFKTLAKRLPFLKGSNVFSIDDIIKECKKQQAISTVKMYNDILQNIDLIKRNYELMKLDITNLTTPQIKQIKESVINAVDKQYNKLAFLRNLYKFGLKNYDPNLLFLTMNILNNNNTVINEYGEC